MNPDMVEQNMIGLKEKVQRMGLPNYLLPAIRERLKDDNQNSFHVYTNVKVENQPLQVSLGFQRSDIKHLYDLDIMRVNGPSNRSNQSNSNIFLLLPENEVNIREAHNLMQGRPVYRPAGDPTKESYWLNLTPIREENGIVVPVPKKSPLVIETSLNNLPFGNVLTAEQKEAATVSLKEGNRYPLKITLNGQTTQVYLEANPKQNRIDVRNSRKELIHDFTKMHERVKGLSR